LVRKASSSTYNDLKHFNEDPKHFDKEIVLKPSILFEDESKEGQKKKMKGHLSLIFA